MMEMSDESKRLLDAAALQLRADVLYDLAAMYSAVEATYDPASWDPRRAMRALADLRRGVRALGYGLGAPWME